MKYWILKSEPDVYSFSDLMRDKKACWDGIRNYQARNNLRAMKSGDIALIYHSNIGKELVGIGKIVREAFKDGPAAEKWLAVDVAAVEAFKKPVTLDVMKKDPALKNLALIKQSRLSVSPVTAEEYKKILELAKG